MIDPLSLINNDMANLKMATDNLFEEWNDNTSCQFNNECMERIQSRYQQYSAQMNSFLRQVYVCESKIEKCTKSLNEL